MVELIMVIIVLGIVASLGAEMIANAYKNYVLQNATHKAAYKMEVAAEKVANLLRHRVPGTAIARNPDDLTDNVLISYGVANDKNHTMIEWIGTAYESFSATSGSAPYRPGWSGFCDLDNSSASALSTPGSDLGLASTIIDNLSGGTVDLNTSGKQRPAIFFRSLQYSSSIFYDPLRCMGLTDNNTSCISKVSGTGTTLTFDSASSKQLREHYKLAWSAYAICPTGDGDNGERFDLVLYYNYQPWEGERLAGGSRCDYNATGLNRSVLVRDITVFKFAESGDAIRIKICAQSPIGEEKNITICKEKVVLK